MIENTSVKSKATLISPNESRGPPSTPKRSVRRRIIRRKYHEAKKEMDKGNYKGSALKDLFHFLNPGIFKNAVGALMSDDESEEDLELLDDSESDDDNDDDALMSDDESEEDLELLDDSESDDDNDMTAKVMMIMMMTRKSSQF